VTKRNERGLERFSSVFEDLDVPFGRFAPRDESRFDAKRDRT
jgi:hypothetical protein